MKATKIFKTIGLVIIGVIAAGALGLALGLVVMGLWNWLMPGIFGLPEITYWQGVGIFILCHLLFKSHGHNNHDEEHSRWFHKDKKTSADFHHGHIHEQHIKNRIKKWLEEDDEAEKEGEEKPGTNDETKVNEEEMNPSAS